MAITGLTLLQKLQKLFGVKNVSNMMGRTSNVQTLGQGTNNPFAATFSKKYLKENPDGVDEAATVILENMQFAFGNKNPRQMKNFESNVNTLYELKFAPAGPEAQVVDLGSKQPVTGKGLLSLKKDMGLPEGVDPNSPMGKMLSSTNRMNKIGRDIGAKIYSSGDEANRASVVREIILEDGRLDLPKEVVDGLMGRTERSLDPIEVFNAIYKRNDKKLEKLDGFVFKGEEARKDSKQVAKDFLDDEAGFDLNENAPYRYKEPEDDIATKLKDYDGDPDAMASGGLAGQLHMNEGGRVAYGKGGITRRAFLQMMGGAAATGAAIKTGLGGLIKTKGLSKIVTPTITKTAGMPDWFPALVKKAWTEGTDVTKKASVHTDGREVVKRVNIKGTDMDVAHNLKTGDVDVVVHGEYGSYNTADNPKTGGLSTAYDEGLEMYYKPASGKNKKPNFEMNEAQAKFEGNPEAPDILTEGITVDLNSTKADLKSLELYAKDKKPSFKDSYKIDKKNKETKKYMENPSDSPEIQNYPDPPEPDIDDFAIGGRVGFVGGGPVKALVQFLINTLVKKKGYNKTLLDNVSNQKNGEKLLKELYEKEIGKIPLTTADKAPIPESTVTRDLFKDANERFNTNIKDRKSAEEVGIDDLFDKDGVLNKDAVLSDITKSVEKTKKSKIVKTKTPNKALLKAMDEVGGSASGDMKYDANILADEYAFQLGLIEEGGDITDIADKMKQMDLYDEAYSALSGQFLKNREIKKMQQFSKPTQTLKSIEDTGTIDISDDKIMGEFETFMRERDPEGMKPIDALVEKINLKGKKRTDNAEGGRIEFSVGGAKVIGKAGLTGFQALRDLIRNLAKERGMQGSEILKLMNYKNLASAIKSKFSKKDFDKFKLEIQKSKIEQLERFKGMFESKVKFNQSIEQGKALDDGGTGLSDIFSYMDESFSKGSPVPRNVNEEDVLKMDQLIKNQTIKDDPRKLNAQGGLNYLMGL